MSSGGPIQREDFRFMIKILHIRVNQYNYLRTTWYDGEYMVNTGGDLYLPRFISLCVYSMVSRDKLVSQASLIHS
jgi:hypothetical protein